MEKIISEISQARNIAVEEKEGNMYVTMDDVVVMTAMKNPEGMFVKMLPDVLTYSDFKPVMCENTLKFDTKDKQSVSFQATCQQFSEIVEIAKTALVNLNLYGYTTED
jgi:hypothetical protein